MSIAKATLISLLLGASSLPRTLAYPAPSPQAPSCIPSSTFALQAVSSDPTINDVYISFRGDVAFLNHLVPDVATFFKNDTTHLYAYGVKDQSTAVELRQVFSFNDGSVFDFETEQKVFYGDYVASDVAFPKPEGQLGFKPEGNDGM